MVSLGIRGAVGLKYRDHETRQLVEEELGKVDFYQGSESPSCGQMFELYSRTLYIIGYAQIRIFER